MTEKLIKLKGVWVECHRCNYGWDCTSQLRLVNCPSCNNKTLRIKEEKKDTGNENTGQAQVHTIINL